MQHKGHGAVYQAGDIAGLNNSVSLRSDYDLPFYTTRREYIILKINETAASSVILR